MKFKLLNFKLLIFIAILFFSFFSMAKMSLAAPSVTDVSGTVEHGQNITISGLNFGTKPTAAPLKWDDFEAYNVGDNILITGDNPWSDYNPDNWTKASSTQVHAGTKAMHGDFTHSQHEGAGVYYDIDTAGGISNCTTVYLSTWVYLKWDATSEYRSRNMKYPRVTAGSADPHTGNPNNSIGALGNSSTGIYVNTVNSFTGPSGWYPEMPSAFPEGQWHHFEYYLKRASAAGVADGISILTIDGIDYINSTSANNWTPDSYGGVYYKHVFPSVFFVAQALYIGGVWTYVNIKYDAYFDDVYIDSTPARVALCTGSTWTARGSCAIQPPSTWDANGDEITATVNLGALTGDTAYLYVCDADNVCNENGYEVTLGGAPDVTPPAAPQGLSVQ